MSLYNEKKQEYFSSIRLDIVDLLPDFSHRVLEIGCGSGNPLEYLKKINKGKETIGIELSPKAANIARNNTDTIFCMDVEKNPIPLEVGKCDLILLLDVLEHLVDPWSFLKKIVNENLTETGKVIVSLPNAKHFTFLLPLFLGKLEYVESGIRDKTHLRFFTKKSATQLINGASLNVEKVKSTSLESSLNSGKLNIITLGIFSSFLTSQYIFLASKNEQ